MDKMVPDPTPLLPPSIPEIQAQIEHLEAAHKTKGFPLSGRIIHLCHHLPVEITRMLPAPQEEEHEEKHDEQDGQSTEGEEGGIGMGILNAPLRGLAATFAAAQSGVLSPPRTPEFKESESLTLSSTGGNSDVKWKLQARRGHTAMISGMRSLSSTHEQIVIAWTGDIMQQFENAPSPKVPQPASTTEPSTNHNTGTPANGPVGQEQDTPIAGLGEPAQVYLPELSEVERKDLERELQNFSKYEEAQEGNGKLSYVPVFVGQEEARGHYEGYCKTSEW